MCLCALSAFSSFFAGVIKFKSTTGFNVETVEYKNISFTVWDVGGQDKVSEEEEEEATESIDPFACCHLRLVCMHACV